MEIQSELQIEIFHTLEKIERVNKAAAFHQIQPDVDQLAITQYFNLKKELTNQLLSLLATMDVRLMAA
jgi:hypothetical protein